MNQNVRLFEEAKVQHELEKVKLSEEIGALKELNQKIEIDGQNLKLQIVEQKSTIDSQNEKLG